MVVAGGTGNPVEAMMAIWGIWRTHTTRRGVDRGWMRLNGKRYEVATEAEAEAMCRKLRLPDAAQRRHKLTYYVARIDDPVTVPLGDNWGVRAVGEGWSVDDDTQTAAEAALEDQREDDFFEEWDRRKRNEREGPYDD